MCRFIAVFAVLCVLCTSATFVHMWSTDHRQPQDIMVDVVNRLGLVILKVHNFNNDNNIALSPYGAASILTSLLEGVRGPAAVEIQQCGGFPIDKDIIRVGLRDIHRLLRSYFIPQEGFLSGLSLSSEKVTLNPEYQSILRFYGFDMTSFNTPIYPDLSTTTSQNNVTTTETNRMTTTDMPLLTEIATFMYNTTKGIYRYNTTTAEPTTLAITTVPQTQPPPTTTVVTTTTRLTTTTPTPTSTPSTTTPTTTTTTLPPTTRVTTTREATISELEDRAATTEEESAETTTLLTTTTPPPATTTAPPTTTTTLPTTTTAPPTTTPEPPTTTLEPPTTTSEPITSPPVTETTTEKETTEAETTTQETTTQEAKERRRRSIFHDMDLNFNNGNFFAKLEELNYKINIPMKQSKKLSTSNNMVEDYIDDSRNKGIEEENHNLKRRKRSIVDDFLTKYHNTFQENGNRKIKKENPERKYISVSSEEVRINKNHTTSNYFISSTYEMSHSKNSTFKNSTNAVTINNKEFLAFTADGHKNTSYRNVSHTVTTILPITSLNKESIVPTSEIEKTAERTTEYQRKDKIITATTEKSSRKKRSLVDYYIARYYDDNHDIAQFHLPHFPNPQPPKDINYSFLVNGKFEETGINFMTYDVVLPFYYIRNLNSLALKFPLDSPKYYLLLILPVDSYGINKLICDIDKTITLKQIVQQMRPTFVRAVIPSFMLRGFIVLTSTLQKIGIRQIFEPRHADFSPMTNDKNIYVTNIEQAITVTIKNYMDSKMMNNRNGQRYQYGPVDFKATHPFLYFVMDTELDVALVAGKIVNPLNSRIQ